MILCAGFLLEFADNIWRSRIEQSHVADLLHPAVQELSMANSRQACLALLLQYHGAGEVLISLFAFFHVVCEPTTLVSQQFPSCGRIPPRVIAREKTISCLEL
jgi:hypothetical protein